MLGKCGICGRRLRIKARCLESDKKICRKCCDLRAGQCEYKMSCWSRIV